MMTKDEFRDKASTALDIETGSMGDMIKILENLGAENVFVIANRDDDMMISLDCTYNGDKETFGWFFRW